MKWQFVAWTLLLGLVACTPITPPASSHAPALWNGVTPIGDIIAHPQAYEGKDVVVVAYYRGWDLFGEAGTGPPLTRSDVVVADATGGIYIVHGRANPNLPPLPPHQPSATDVLLRVRGIVRISPTGQPYIDVMETSSVEGLPLGVVLRVRRHGTIAGLDEELMVQEDGHAYLLDRKTSHKAHFTVDPQELTRVLDRLRPYVEEREIGTPVPDTTIYDVTLWQGDKIRTLRIYEWQAPVEEALRIIDRWYARGRGE